jgi:hypothetical protein
LSNVIIQLGFDERDTKLWWLDCFKWDDDSVENVNRPTEIAAFRRMYKQSRLLQKRGVFINLSALHLRVLRLEHKALTREVRPDNVSEWISSQLAGVSILWVNKMLDECDLVIELRDALGMSQIDIEWNSEPAQKGRKAA